MIAGWFVLLWVAGSVPAGAQSGTGRITGVVTDPLGGVIQRASVVVSEVDTGLRRQTTSNDGGLFAAVLLPPGNYRVTVHKPGFGIHTRSGIKLDIGQVVRIDFVLEIGTVLETIQVAGSTILDTDTSEIAQVIGERQVANLPLNGRNFTQLLMLAPGAVQTSGEQGQFRAGVGDAITIMGARPSSNQYLLDGMANNDTLYQTPAIVPSIDAIREFKEQTGNYTAENGASANQISISIKSGTNELHGTAFDFLRNDRLDARNFFDGASVAPLRQNQFGYTLGGPVYLPVLYDGRNRTFFFANYEGQRTRTEAHSFIWVPATDELAGRFTAPVRDPVTGQLFPQDSGGRYVIPRSLFSTFGEQFRSHFPAPDVNTPQGNYFNSIALPTNANQQHYRIDQDCGARNALFLRVSFTDYATINTPGGSGLLAEGQAHLVQRNRGYQAGYTRIVSPAVVNQFRFGYLAATANQMGIAASQAALDALHLSGLFPLPDAPYPVAQFTNTNLAPVGGALNVPKLNAQPTFDLSDALSINRGAHTLSIGLNWRRWHLQDQGNATYGTYSFDGSFTGHPLADLLLGHPYQIAVSQPTAFSDLAHPGDYVDVRRSLVAPYFEDDWKVSRRLTLNLGVRYDFSSLPYEQRNHFGWFDASIPGGGLLVADKSLIDRGLGGSYYRYAGGRTPFPAQKKVLAPRAGLAFRPFRDAATVVRAGYGVFFDSSEDSETHQFGNFYPYSVRQLYQATAGFSLLDTNTLFPSWTAAGPVTPSVLSFLFTQAPRKRNPYVQQWSLSIQRELALSTKLELSYVGSKGTHLVGRRGANQPFAYDPSNPTPPEARLPYPNLGTVIADDWDMNSSYNAMNVKLEHKTGPMYLLAAYTWSKSLDEKSAAAGLEGDSAGWVGPMKSDNFRLDHALSSYDVGRRLVASFVYELPVGPNKRIPVRGPVETVLGGWQLNGIATFQQGFPFSINGTDVDFLNRNFGQRADLVGDPLPAGFRQTRYQWFRTGAFRNPAAGAYGTAGRNLIRSPGMGNWDLSLFKSLSFKEQVRLQVRLESFNAFNRTHFGQPDANVQDASFGVISSAKAARVNQLGMKVIW